MTAIADLDRESFFLTEKGEFDENHAIRPQFSNA